MSWFQFKPYVSVAQRRANAMKEVAKLANKGQTISPVKIEGRKIVGTFWGKAWCDNLEAYSDFASRLPRGRSYVRNGSVVDLQIKPGSITAMVSGSELYRVKITIKPLQASTWDGIRQSCSGKIASVIELLKGSISDHVMQIVTNQSTGLFPSPMEIEMDCSCPDWAGMCKHVAATMYGVGARLDNQPDLIFSLRKVDHLDLIAQAADLQTLQQSTTGAKTIDAASLGDVFGIEINDLPTAQIAAVSVTPALRKRRSTSAAPLKARSVVKPIDKIKKTDVKSQIEVNGRPRKQHAAKSLLPKGKIRAGERSK
jgi:uncharacterized Zn finger protein